VELDGLGSTDNIGVVTWEWTVPGAGDDPLAEFLVFHTFHDVGSYEISLIVADGAGNTGTTTITVNVTDADPPVADGGMDAVADPAVNVTFSGKGSTDNVGVSGYSWTFSYGGEEIVLTGKSPEFPFIEPGEYEITLTVTDPAGNAGVDTVVITVPEPDPVLQPPEPEVPNTGSSKDNSGDADGNDATAALLVAAIVAIVAAVILLMLMARRKKRAGDDARGDDDENQEERADEGEDAEGPEEVGDGGTAPVAATPVAQPASPAQGVDAPVAASAVEPAGAAPRAAPVASPMK
jgi:PKD repeat protein